MSHARRPTTGDIEEDLRAEACADAAYSCLVKGYSATMGFLTDQERGVFAPCSQNAERGLVLASAALAMGQGSEGERFSDFLRALGSAGSSSSEDEAREHLEIPDTQPRARS